MTTFFLPEKPNSVVLIVHRRVEVKYLLISEKHTLACRHCQSMQQSFAALQSRLFRCSVDHLSWNTTKRREWQIELRNAQNTLLTDTQVFGNTACALAGSRCVFLWASQIINLFDVVRRPCWSRSFIFHCLVFAQWLNLADQHVGMFFTECKFNCLSGNFETILLYPKPSSHSVWILMLSLADILPIINGAKIQILFTK